MKRMFFFLALLLGVGVLFRAGAVQSALAEDLVRFHVIANSDLPYDQEIKRAVRDAVVGYAETLTRDTAARKEAEEVFSAHLGDLEELANRALSRYGVSYRATARMTHGYFPTKSYAGFRLPAGDYHAVTLTLGEGKGQNFWCVLFPPLCLSPTAIQTAASDLTDAEKALLTRGDTVTRYRFFTVELAGKLRHKIEAILN